MTSGDGDDYQQMVHRLASMDSEQLLRTMKQVEQKRTPADEAPVPAGKRTARKRTKTAKATEAAELEAELSPKSHKRARTTASAPLFAAVPTAPAAPAPALQRAASPAPSHFAPAHSAPVHSDPAHSAPAHPAPAHPAPAHPAPAHPAPANPAPAHPAPAHPAPDHPALAHPAPAHSAPAHSAPAHSAPAHSAPAHPAPAHAAPAHPAPPHPAPAHPAPPHPAPAHPAPPHTAPAHPAPGLPSPAPTAAAAPVSTGSTVAATLTPASAVLSNEAAATTGAAVPSLFKPADPAPAQSAQADMNSDAAGDVPQELAAMDAGVQQAVNQSAAEQAEATAMFEAGEAAAQLAGPDDHIVAVPPAHFQVDGPPAIRPPEGEDTEEDEEGPHHGLPPGDHAGMHAQHGPALLPQPASDILTAASAANLVQNHATAEMLLAQHMQAGAAVAAAAMGEPHGDGSENGADGSSPNGVHGDQGEAMETATKFTGVRRNKGGRFSARIKLGGVNKYLGSFKTAEEAARAFDAMAIENGRPVETLNFPAAYGGPTVGQAYRKRKVHKLYADPQNHINVLLQKLGDVDRSNPGILRLTMGTLGVPESRYLADNKYSGIRQQSSHWETRIRYKDKLYSMGFYASVEAAALAWDITAASLRRCRKLNFPEVSFADLEQQLDALKCVISQTSEHHLHHMPMHMHHMGIPGMPQAHMHQMGMGDASGSDPNGNVAPIHFDPSLAGLGPADLVAAAQASIAAQPVMAPGAGAAVDAGAVAAPEDVAGAVVPAAPQDYEQQHHQPAVPQAYEQHHQQDVPRAYEHLPPGVPQAYEHDHVAVEVKDEEAAGGHEDIHVHVQGDVPQDHMGQELVLQEQPEQHMPQGEHVSLEQQHTHQEQHVLHEQHVGATEEDLVAQEEREPVPQEHASVEPQVLQEPVPEEHIQRAEDAIDVLDAAPPAATA